MCGLSALAGAQSRRDRPLTPGWEGRVDSLLTDPTLQYAAILDIMRPARHSDSVMVYMRNRAAAVEHLSAESFAISCQSIIRRYASEYQPALQLAQQADQLAAQARDTLGRMVALNSQGVIYRRLDRIIEALDVHQTALELANGLRDPDFGSLQAHAIALNSKGQIHLSLNESELAAESFRRSLKIDLLNDNRLGLAINTGNLARIFEQRGALDSALVYYKRAIAYNEELDSQLGLAICYTGLSEVLRKQDNPRLALEYARRAMPLAEAHGDDTYTVSARVQLGTVLSEIGEYATAGAQLNRALETATERKLIDEQSRAHYALATLDERRGVFASALDHYRQAHDLERTVLNENNQRYVTAVNARWEAEQNALQIADLARENAVVRDQSTRATRFAIAVIVALSLLAVLMGVLYRQRRLVLQRDIARLEQQRMASQMNPHFLFNALNSIKAEMIGGRSHDAILLLGQFASYMRRILSSSIDEAVTLAEELRSAQLYFAIENSRLSRSVAFELVIDPEVDPEEVMVPPLILQPFIENALLHGLRGKDGDKTLTLRVRAAAPHLVEVRIRDNGVGREAAGRKVAPQPRESYGLNITRRRLEHFAKRRGGKTTEVELVDLHDDRGVASGTEAVLRWRM